MNDLDLLYELSGDEPGSFTITTESGTVYVVDCTRGFLQRFPNVRPPTTDFASIPVYDLRRDESRIPIIRIERLVVGERGVLILDVVEDGQTVTVRSTTPVLSIERTANTG
ncbi:hypothetical protein [Arthrobacter sp. CAN_C5]|uniref:hypothetical protein n=1 Tax=Arthrobacter sp. CAN_C5 TaxID=2760706 RepID=UPI001AE3221C|nr:hypothetical protein [Arthrobacter sp. CAN_C5]MBP2216039.1 hypothetical protein [Arthrobacter sp. CAN_C5]